jgi:hypothetical protein
MNVGSTFEMIYHIMLNTHLFGGTYGFFDNIKMLASTSQNPWEIESDASFGSVLQIATNYTLSISSSDKYVILEEQYLMTQGNLNIKQFAISVSTINNFSSFQLVLHLNGYDCGYYDSIYYYAGLSGVYPRYVLVWENINLSFPDESDLSIEFLVVGNTTSGTFTFTAFTGDIDADGTIDFKWSSGASAAVLPYFNGIYDGLSGSSISEFQYKIWADYTSGTYLCGYNVDAYDYKGEYVIGTTVAANHFVEIHYDILASLRVRFFELFIGSQTYAVASQTSDYYLKINGEPQGAADCIREINSDWYRVLWNVSYLSVNDDTVFEVSCPGAILVVSRPSYDVDGDGVKAYSYHNSYSLWNGVFDGTVSPYDISYRMYYENENFTFTNETSPFNDLITSTGTEFLTYETVPIFYFISDYTYVNTIELWKDGVEQTDQGFPFTVTSGTFKGELSYLPFHNGSYALYLIRNSVIVSSFNFTVADPVDTDFILNVRPNPCMFNTEASIFYRFFPDDGSDGFIGVSFRSDTSNVSEFVHYWFLSSNVSGNVSFYPQNYVYVTLWKKTGSSYSLLRTVYLKLFDIIEDTINVRYKTIQLSFDNPVVIQRIYGYRTANNFKTIVRLNNKVLQDVTDRPYYRVDVAITKAGNYLAELCMETSNGTIVLAAVNFSVTVSASSGPEGGEEAFDPTMKALFGICFVIVSVCVPLMISVKYHANVPTFVYVIFMAFGIGLGTKLGFLDLWLVFLFVVALVAGAVYTIFGHGGPGPGTGSGGGDRTIRERVFTRRGNDEGVRRNGR